MKKLVLLVCFLAGSFGANDAQAYLRVRQIAVGAEFVCVVTVPRDIKCWGDNAYGQLGQGDTRDRGDDVNEMGDSLPFVDIAANGSVTAIEAGQTHVCAIFGKGRLKCWGHNARGQLGLGHPYNRGDNSSEMGSYLPAVDVAPGHQVSQVAVGGQHTCALLDDGSVKCWGANDSGQLGLGDTEDRGDESGEMGNALPFVDLGQGRIATKIAAGNTHSCAILDDGSVKCWGDASFGQLGAGTTYDRGNTQLEMGTFLSPIDLGTGKQAVRIQAGNDHTCAQFTDDSTKCWGRNDRGQLGLGDAIARGDSPGEMGDDLLPVSMGAFIEPANRLGTGSFHSCAILGSYLRCWGSNGAGELGLGDMEDRGDDPQEMSIWLPNVPLGAGRTPVQVEGGWQFTCARFANERVKCWGHNLSGQLGYGHRDALGRDSDDMGDNLPFVDVGS